MKIGILTYFYGYNFGGVLQCYALQQTLKNMGYGDVHVVNCIPSRLKFYLGGIPRRREMRTIYDLYLRFRYGRRCRKAFDGFRIEFLNMTPFIKRKNLPNAMSRFDALIVGSDQIWNIREQSNGMFFLDWEPVFKNRKIAYAPCCGKNEVNEKYKNNIKHALLNFSSLSVRNDETASFVENLIGVRPSIVPDPTCLYDFREFSNLKRIINEKYVFIYILGNEIRGGNKNAIKIIREKFKDCKIIASVIAYSNPQPVDWADEVKYSLSPIEWLNMIQNAEFVFTDSFHGTIFSMRYNVPFLTFYSEERRKSRFFGLMKQFGIERNIVSSLDEICSYDIERRNFDNVFNKLSEEGRNYLRTALS